MPGCKRTVPEMGHTGDVADARSTSLLERLAELERSDADLAAAVERVAGAALRADQVRARATEIAAALAAMPAERARLDDAEAAARRRLVGAREELEAAEYRLAEIEASRRPREEQRAQVQRDVVAARDAVASIDAQLHRIAERRTALAEDEPVLRAESEGLVVAAAEIATAIALIDGVSDSGRAQPGTTLTELDEWGARTHAALFVVRGTLESHRERVVSEANVLAASVLVEHLAATSVADVRRRVAAALA